MAAISGNNPKILLLRAQREFKKAAPERSMRYGLTAGITEAKIDPKVILQAGFELATYIQNLDSTSLLARTLSLDLPENSKVLKLAAQCLSLKQVIEKDRQENREARATFVQFQDQVTLEIIPKFHDHKLRGDAFTTKVEGKPTKTIYKLSQVGEIYTQVKGVHRFVKIEGTSERFNRHYTIENRRKAKDEVANSQEVLDFKETEKKAIVTFTEALELKKSGWSSLTQLLGCIQRVNEYNTHLIPSQDHISEETLDNLVLVNIQVKLALLRANARVVLSQAKMAQFKKLCDGQKEELESLEVLAKEHPEGEAQFWLETEAKDESYKELTYKTSERINNVQIQYQKIWNKIEENQRAEFERKVSFLLDNNLFPSNDLSRALLNQKINFSHKISLLKGILSQIKIAPLQGSKLATLKAFAQKADSRIADKLEQSQFGDLQLKYSRLTFWKRYIGELKNMLEVQEEILAAEEKQLLDEEKKLTSQNLPTDAINKRILDLGLQDRLPLQDIILNFQDLNRDIQQELNNKS